MTLTRLIRRWLTDDSVSSLKVPAKAKFQGNPKLELKLAARRRELVDRGDAWDLDGGRGPRIKVEQQ